MKEQTDLPVILITGTSRGIGNFLAHHFLAENYFVIGCSRSASTISNDNYYHFNVDVSDENAVMGVFKYIRAERKRLDILINNAAINPAIVMLRCRPMKQFKNI
ncbi:MAG: SDR family NAD(P)-dependent oxidoreductase [Chitinophagaceae bacterium]|nr:SDR family NAD(P)-dependent oxidoreductase [Chitinophagaceae bacterium]